MDGDRFDAVARALAAPSRRGVLLLGGVALCGIAGILEKSGAEPRPGDRKRARRRKRKRERRRRPKPGEPLYPDLQTLRPADLRFAQVGEARVLRFTNTVWNAGPGRLELEASTFFDPEAGEVYQNLYDAPIKGNRVGRKRVDGEIVYHPTHAHYHFADFASYQLLQRAEGATYAPIGDSAKTGFCITDNFLKEGSYPRQYGKCEERLQGLTPGWRDTYRWDVLEQWVALDEWPMADGEYGLQSIADPDGLLDEGGGDRETNNGAVAYFTVEAGQITNVRDSP